MVGSIELSLEVCQRHFSRALADLHQVRRLFVVHVVYHFGLLHDGCLTRLPAASLFRACNFLASFRLLLGYGTSTGPTLTMLLCVQKRNWLEVGADDTLHIKLLATYLPILHHVHRRDIYLSFASCVPSFGADNGVQFLLANE